MGISYLKMERILSKKFSLKLNSNLIINKTVKPKDLRILAISNVNAHESLIQAATLINYRDTSIANKNYIRNAIAFEGK